MAGSSSLESGRLIAATEVWRVTRRRCNPSPDSADVRSSLLTLACTNSVVPGDVLVSRTIGDEEGLEAVAKAVLADSVVMRRDRHVRDVYQSAFANSLLASAGTRPSQHLQLRNARILDTALLQVAIYPVPPRAGETRLWCDAAVVWLFVPSGKAGDSVVAFLTELQPLWERLRAHHSFPLDRNEPHELIERYPVPRRMGALAREDRDSLDDAVLLLSDHGPILALLAQATSPRIAVERILDARYRLLRHLERMTLALQHSHGSARSKYESVREAALESPARVDPGQVEHVLAPHRHLVDGLEETQRNLVVLAEQASATASLITSAAVSRLLDRSSANRISGTAIAAVASLPRVFPPSRRCHRYPGAMAGLSRTCLRWQVGWGSVESLQGSSLWSSRA
jgi:hypothetical protein